ncbi:MAG: DUF4956 domain-containing protein [Erysipelotrichaceae bacterium]|nr:DUF4956 domain-containing protein [Erysipelotrichaceae bacterium]
MYLSIIKDSVLNQFTGTLTLADVGLSLLTAFLISIFIIFVYKKTYSGVLYSKTFSLCLLMLSMVTALIIRTVNANLSLSLGMVGALSIVRFRTAVKEPIDTGFMFWGISAGIMAGAGLYLIAIIASILLGVLYFIGYLFGFKSKSKYLLVLKYDSNNESEVNKLLKSLPKHKLKTKTSAKKVTEVTYEVEVKNEDTKFMNNFLNDENILVASLVSYQNEFGD